jgi:hypothetical protein
VAKWGTASLPAVTAAICAGGGRLLAKNSAIFCSRKRLKP